MSEKLVTFADAKARLSELTDLAAAGESVIITKHGKPVARVSRVQPPRQPISFERLQRLTSAMPLQEEEAGIFVREMRDETRY